MVVTWASPGPLRLVDGRRRDGAWFWIYQLNPMTVAVEVFHWAFWEPTLKADQLVSGHLPPGLLTLWLPVALLITLGVLFLGQLDVPPARRPLCTGALT